MSREKKEKEKKPWVLTDRRRHNIKVSLHARQAYMKLGKDAYIKKHGHSYRSADEK